MKTKQTMAKAVCTLATLALVSSAAFSYFTDKEEKTNTFTIGSVDVVLEEPSWPGDDPTDESEKDLVPCEVVAKDPQITNTGKNDAYVYLEVTLPKATVVTANEDGTKNEAQNQALFTYTINDGWTLMDEYTAEDSTKVTYVYAYNQVLSPLETTQALFNEVTLINLIEGQDIEMTQNIDIVAKAIQKDGVGSIQEAYSKLNNQLA